MAENNPSTLHNGLLNFAKGSQLAQPVLDLAVFQEVGESLRLGAGDGLTHARRLAM